MNNFQRKGASSNAQAGREFEAAAQKFFESEGLALFSKLKLSVGVAGRKKEHAFDLGCADQKVIVECKSHKWTESGNMPSAKITVWNEAMYLFALAPREYRKILFVLRDFHQKRGETLAQYYLRTNFHLVPDDVDFWEYDEKTSRAKKLPKQKAPGAD
ncbi:MAG: hypothetical protein MPK62_13015 [Alphaproteobacteria bacterium]|nr:hypothetical protein [Alphaproteobacteria bacterium]